MTDETLALARSFIDAFTDVDLVEGLAGDPASSPLAMAFVAVADPQVEIQLVNDSGIPTVFHGLDGYLDAWRDWTRSFDRFVLEESAPPAVGDTTLVNFVRQRGRIAGSSAEVTAEGAAAWFFEGERLVRIEFHLDEQAALRAAGL